MWNEQQFYLLGQIQTSQTGGQLYNDTSPMVSVVWLFDEEIRQASFCITIDNKELLGHEKLALELDGID